ncbi:MAG: hypothetical protein DME01_00980 [Candidatus Rokuibacteriota bacterium]|nr:MAG: hypothetical protein DME01_00980 [Candidatus Rokubacteria bacterium]
MAYEVRGPRTLALQHKHFARTQRRYPSAGHIPEGDELGTHRAFNLHQGRLILDREAFLREALHAYEVGIAQADTRYLLPVEVRVRLDCPASRRLRVNLDGTTRSRARSSTPSKQKGDDQQGHHAFDQVHLAALSDTCTI